MINEKMIEDLVELGIYKSRSLEKEEYEKLSANNSDESKMYITGSYSNDTENDLMKYYKEIDTNGLSIEEVMLQLDIEKTKNIKSIKSMVIFFVVVAVISLICIFFFGMSLSEALNQLYILQ